MDNCPVLLQAVDLSFEPADGPDPGEAQEKLRYEHPRYAANLTSAGGISFERIEKMPEVNCRRCDLGVQLRLETPSHTRLGANCPHSTMREAYPKKAGLLRTIRSQRENTRVRAVQVESSWAEKKTHRQWSRKLPFSCKYCRK